MKTNEQVLGLYASSTDGVTFVTSDSDTTRRNRPGELAFIQAREGYRVYRYMKAEEAFAIGQVAMVSANYDDADVDAAAAITEKTLTGLGDFTASEFGDGTFPSAYAHINANTTGFGQTRSILRNSANILTLDKNWDVALTAASDYLTFDVNYVSLCDTDDVSARASSVFGVAISAIADESWGWFQVGGFCPVVRCVGTTDATIRGAIVVPSSTAGACKGPTAGGTTADEAGLAFGIALADYSSADTAGRGVPVLLNCKYLSI